MVNYDGKTKRRQISTRGRDKGLAIKKKYIRTRPTFHFVQGFFFIINGFIFYLIYFLHICIYTFFYLDTLEEYLYKCYARFSVIAVTTSLHSIKIAT